MKATKQYSLGVVSTVPGGELNFLVTVELYCSYPKWIFLTRNLLLHSSYSKRFGQTSNFSKAIVINSVCLCVSLLQSKLSV